MTDSVVCRSCNEPAPADAVWCEACGADLATEPADAAPSTPDAAAPAFVATDPCTSCGTDPSNITADGWCEMCGAKQPAPGDHVTEDGGWFALVSDRGVVHRSNEDAGAVSAERNRLVLVVCDGVSSTDDSHHASQAAAAAAREAIQMNESASRDALVAGALAAQSAVIDATPEGTTEPPSCTLVAAVAEPFAEQAFLVTVAWLGDSRAYWIDGAGIRSLTHDHSWAREQLDLGELDAESIASDSRAHSITRWLGADAVDTAPDIAELNVNSSGLLLLCSDGLWNYAEQEADMEQLIKERGGLDANPLDLAEQLVAFANESGGHDNITVALARLPHDLTNTQSRSPDV